MQLSKHSFVRRVTAGLVGLALLGPAAASDSSRGLWVGQVTLNYVTEVSVPFDENNIAVAPDPNVPTPTADQAHLRLILHVNGAGQVSLLKDVALLNRLAPAAGSHSSLVVDLTKNPSALNFQESYLKRESDIALVTDPRLYGEFPPQPAQRIASAVFDFGDSKASLAMDELIEAAAHAAANSVFSTQEDLDSATGRTEATGDAVAAALSAANPIVGDADVAKAFSQFLLQDLPRAKVTQIAGNVSLAGPVRLAGLALQAKFYGDARAVQMVDAIVAAVEAAPNAAAKLKAAHNTAATYADLEDNYHRFIASKLFGDMIVSAAKTAADAGVVGGATLASIRAAVNADALVVDAKAEALRIQVSAYDESRAQDAVTLVVEAMITKAGSALPATPAAHDVIQSDTEQAGRVALADSVARYVVPSQHPTSAYNEFVASSAFKGSPNLAAKAAAEAAVTSRRNDPLFTATSLRDAATVAAVNALRSVLVAAAGARRTELPMTGGFGPGRGDPRLRWDIKQTGGPALGAAALTGTIVLPADHPTNPFRHRRHPDHAVGFDLRREIRLDFDGSANDPLASAGFGVKRITGTYREEIFGLHKPLGPDPVSQPIGLRVEGRFELNRISLIDTLNAR